MKKRGFTLIEVIAAMLVISIVTGLMAASYNHVDRELTELINKKQEYNEKLEEYR